MSASGSVVVRDPGPAGCTTFLVSLTPTRPDWPAAMTPDEDAAIAAHFEHLRALTEAGTCVLAGPTLDAQLGVCVLDGVDVSAAAALLRDDPMVVAGFFDAELRAMRLSLERVRP